MMVVRSHNRLKTFFYLLSPICFFLMCCQKAVPDDLSQVTPPEDSVWLVKTVYSKDYETDPRNTLAVPYHRMQVFDYDIPNNKIAVTIYDTIRTDIIGKFTETYTYDNSNRLTVFETSYDPSCMVCPVLDFDKISFEYKLNGELDKAQIRYLSGEIVENRFTYKTLGDETIVTLYDTSQNALFLGRRNNRPRIIEYTFDKNKRMQNRFERVTHIDHKEKAHWFKTINHYQFNFDPVSNIKQVVLRSNELEFDTVYSRLYSDTFNFYRHPERGMELYHSYHNLYRNLYWFTVADYPGRFGDALFDFPFYTAENTYYQINSIERFQGIYTARTNQFADVLQTVFRNQYDANNLLTQTEFSSNLDDRSTYKTEIHYTYIKVKK